MSSNPFGNTGFGPYPPGGSPGHSGTGLNGLAGAARARAGAGGVDLGAPPEKRSRTSGIGETVISISRNVFNQLSAASSVGALGGMPRYKQPTVSIRRRASGKAPRKSRARKATVIRELVSTNTSKFPINTVIMKTHHPSRYFSTLNMATGVPTLGCYTNFHCLSDFPQYVGYTSMYAYYRIKKVRVQIIPQFDGCGVSGIPNKAPVPQMYADPAGQNPTMGACLALNAIAFAPTSGAVIASYPLASPLFTSMDAILNVPGVQVSRSDDIIDFTCVPVQSGALSYSTSVGLNPYAVPTALTNGSGMTDPDGWNSTASFNSLYQGASLCISPPSGYIDSQRCGPTWALPYLNNTTFQYDAIFTAEIQFKGLKFGPVGVIGAEAPAGP